MITLSINTWEIGELDRLFTKKTASKRTRFFFNSVMII